MIFGNSPGSRFFGTFFLTACALLGETAAAAQDPGSAADYGQAFAQVWRIHGEVTATAPDGTVRRLSEGAAVVVGDSVRTSASGEVVLRTIDQGVLALRPNSELSAENYAAKHAEDDRQYLRLLKGSLRIVSGWIAKLNPSRYRLTTPTATIGVRGTDHESYILELPSAGGANLPGTYDKVNRGSTVLEANGGKVVIEGGKVGFARDPESVKIHTRALMTILLPVILDKVPDFFVPGRFDREIDRLAAEEEGTPPPAAAPAAPNTQAAAPRPLPPKGCLPARVGRRWLAVLDDALARRDAATVLGLFAPELRASATVRQADGSAATQVFERDDFVQSTIRTLSGLADYRQQRLKTESHSQGKRAQGECPDIRVRSEVVESGLMNGQPYRLHAVEEYLLRRRNGAWLAVEASTTQK